MVLRRLERAPEVVQDRQELCQNALAGQGHHALVLARGALAVVVEVRRHAAQVAERLLVPRLGVLQSCKQLVASSPATPGSTSG